MTPADPKTTKEGDTVSAQPVSEAPVLPVAKLTRNKLKDNPILFYGIPLMVVFIVIGGVMFFVLPTIQFYSQYNSEKKILEKNSKTVDKSVSNLEGIFAQEEEIKKNDASLSEFIPVEPKLGDVINLIQSKAKDFNLESKVGTNNGGANTSVDTLAKKSEDNEALFQSLTSGEIVFQPKSLNTDVDAILLSIEVSIKGDRGSFLKFLADMQDIKPIVNLVFVEYTEAESIDNQSSIIALLRFESYALKLDTDNVKLAVPRLLKNDDAALTRDIREEKFEVDPVISQTLSDIDAE
jgi:Tfp pilus assembly protein PilO